MPNKADAAKKRWAEAEKRNKAKRPKKKKRGNNLLENISGFVKGVKDIYGGRGAAEKVKKATQ